MSVFWNIIETFSIVITAACVTFVSLAVFWSHHALRHTQTIFFIIQTLYPQCNVVPEAHTKIRRAKQRRTLSTNRVTFAENHEETPSQAFESRPKCIVKSILKRSAPTILAETASVVSKPSLSVSPGESCAPDTCTRRPSFSTYSIEVIEHTEVVSYNIAPSDGPIVSLAPVVRQIGKGLPRRLSGFEPSLTLSSDGTLMIHFTAILPSWLFSQTLWT